jgi:hypothetical protein
MKLFKRKQQVEIQDEGEWWKDPRLGTDDDEGAYDYYACGKPDNNQYMCWSTCKCDDCRKEPRFKRYGEAWNAYWYCYDGWDGDSGFVCWKCLLSRKIYHWKSQIKKKYELRKEFREMWKKARRKMEQSGTDKQTIKKTHDELYKIIVKHEM